MKKINILHIVEDLKIGGIERVIYNIVTNLNKEKYNVFVWCLTKGGEIAYEILKNQINVEILGMTDKPRISFLLNLTKKLKEKKINIIHSHGYTATTIARFCGILTFSRIILLSHVHTLYLEFTKKQYLIERFLSFFTYKIICCSNAVREFMLDKVKIDCKKLVVIYNGVEEKQIKYNLKDLLHICEEEKVVGYIGRIEKLKGLDYLIEAAKILSNEGELKIKYLIVGDGTEKTNLIEKVKNLGIENIFIFIEKQKDILPYLATMDIIVLPSIFREGLGMTLVEAISLGKPIIGTEIGGIPEVVIDGENGFLVKPKDSKNLADAIKKIFSNKELYTQMSKNAKRIYFEKFTLKEMINKIEKIYDTIL